MGGDEDQFMRLEGAGRSTGTASHKMYCRNRSLMPHVYGDQTPRPLW